MMLLPITSELGHYMQHANTQGGQEGFFSRAKKKYADPEYAGALPATLTSYRGIAGLTVGWRDTTASINSGTQNSD